MMSMLMNRNNGMIPAAMNELMKSVFGTFPEFPARWNAPWVPSSRLDVTIREKEIFVRFPCPGCKPENFSLETTGDVLTVRVESRPEPEETEEKRFTRRERSFESYEESIKFPVPVRGGEAKAKYTDGILEITLPRLTETKPASKRIEVK